MTTAGTALALAACSGSNAPTELPPDPAIVWPDGEPSSPLEADPAVQAVRAMDLAVAHAINAHYFADPEFQDNTMTEQFRRMNTASFPNSNHGVFVYPGPTPMEPLSVTNTEPGVYKVTVCLLEDWRQYANGWRRDYKNVASEAVYTVLDFNGHLLVDSEVVDDWKPCDPTPIKRGYFDPAPTPDPDLRRDDINYGPEAYPTTQVTDK